MKILKISSVIALTSCFILQLIPYGILIKTANVAMYYSYFSLVAWGNGVIGPFFCGGLTLALIGLIIGTFFLKKPRRAYLLSINIISWITAILSLFPIMFNAYTAIGGIISALLLFCAEASLLIYNAEFKK